MLDATQLDENADTVSRSHLSHQCQHGGCRPSCLPGPLRILSRRHYISEAHAATGAATTALAAAGASTAACTAACAARSACEWASAACSIASTAAACCMEACMLPLVC